MRRNNFPDIPFSSNLKMTPLCQTLSNPFDFSRNAPRTSYSLSNDAYIPWAVDKSWLIQKSQGLSLIDSWKQGDLLWTNQTSRYIKDIQIFFHISEEVRWDDSLLEIVYHFFLWTEITFAFFHSSEKNPTF